MNRQLLCFVGTRPLNFARKFDPDSRQIIQIDGRDAGVIAVEQRDEELRAIQYADLGGPKVELFSGGVRQGRLDLDRFVSETISIDDVEEAFHKMERGEVLRSVVVV